jgi:hypothetical protein
MVFEIFGTVEDRWFADCGHRQTSSLQFALWSSCRSLSLVRDTDSRYVFTYGANPFRTVGLFHVINPLSDRAIELILIRTILEQADIRLDVFFEVGP